MKLALYSDLHLEMHLQPKSAMPWRPSELDIDVVVFAGDIAGGTDGLRWAAEAFRQCPVSPEILYVAGNHEYYGRDRRRLLAEMRETATKLGIHFLENDVLVLNGVRFLGTTLWSDFELYGRAAMAEHMTAAQQRIRDYSTILSDDDRCIDPQETRYLHLEARAFLERELEKPFSGKTVVVTHFAPRPECVPEQFRGSVLSPYFTSDMTPLMRRYAIDLWAFGHTHHNINFVEGGCRIVSNQMGYPTERCAGFVDGLIEV